MERMIRRKHLLAISLVVAATVLSTTCDNPVDLLEEVQVEVMKANKRFLEVVSFTPAENAITVNPGNDIRIQFDRELDLDSVTTETVRIMSQEATPVEVPWILTYDSSTRLLKIRPNPYLEDTTGYSITIDGLTGSDGSELSSSMTWGFETGIAPKGIYSVTSTDPDSLEGFSRVTSVDLTVDSSSNATEWYATTSYAEASDPSAVDGASWKTVATDFNLTLSSTQGTQTVYAVFRATSPVAFGAVVDRNIEYDSVAPSAPVVSGTTPTTDRTPTWSWSGGGGGNATFRYQVDAGAWTSPATTTSYTSASDLALGNHTVNVNERDEAGNWSTNGSKLLAVQPLPPTSVSATDWTSTTSITVSWTASADATAYYVDRATSSTGTYTNIGNTASSPYTDSTGTPGTFYYYKVRAYGGTLYSAQSSYNSGIRAVSAPASIAATDNTSSSYVTVSWSAATGATSYYVYRATSSTGTYLLQTSSGVTGTSYNDSSATPGIIYYYKVRGYANGYYSDYSTYDSGVRKLATPASVTASDGENSTGVVIAWGTVTDATNYYVYRCATYNGTYLDVSGAVTGTTWTDTAPAVSTTYYYEVRAQANGYYSDYSAYNAGYKGLASVTGLTARTQMLTNSIQLSWTAPAGGADGYRIYQYNSATGIYDYYTYATTTTKILAPSSYNTSMYYKIRAYSNSSSYPGVWSGYVSGQRLGLNGYWAFESAWTDVGLADSTYDNFSITSGSPTFSTTHFVGSYSAYFYPYSEKVTSSEYTFMSTDRKKVSVSYWIYPTKLTTSLMWAIKCGDFSVGFSGTQVTMTISTPSTSSATTTLALNTWHHIVGTYDGSNIRIYKNGALMQTTAHPGTASSNSTYLYIDSGTSSNYWTGYIDDLRIYNVTLTSAQVLDLYNFD